VALSNDRRSGSDSDSKFAILVAVAIVVAATLIRWLFSPLLGDNVPFITYFLAVVIAAWYGGIRPALVATGLSCVAAWFFFVPHYASFAIEDAADLVGLLVFLVTGSAIAVLGGRMRRAERHARQRESLLRVTLASIGDAVITTDTQGKVTALNAVAATLTGWPEQEAIGRPIQDIMRIENEATGESVKNPVGKVLAQGSIVGLANHTILISRDGSQRPIDDSAAPIRDERGNIVGVVLVFRDIAERKAAEVALLRSERDLSDFFDNAIVGLHWVGPDGIILRANRADMDLVGYSPHEYIGHHIAEFHADKPVIEDILRRLHAGEQLRDYAARLRCKDGSIKDVLIDSSVLRIDGKFVHSRCFTRDVTQRKRDEMAARRLAAIIESSDDAIVGKDLNGAITSWNQGAERIFGYTADEMIGQSILLLIPPEHAGEEETILARLRRGERIEHYETVRVTKDGRRIDVSLSIAPLRDSNGALVGASKISRDITARKRAELALRESEHRFASFMQSLPGLAWIKDTMGRYVFVNEAAQRPFGMSRVRLYGKTDDEIFPPDIAAQFKENDQRALNSGRGIEVVEMLEHEDGMHYSIVSKFPIPDAGGKAANVGGVAIDITERMRAEEALRQADRRKDEFLATLAHELRNPLAPVCNAVQILRTANGDEEAARSAIEMIERQSSQMVRLIDDLLDVSRISRGKITLRMEQVELTEVVHQAIDAARPLFAGMDQELTVEISPEPIYVSGDSIRLSQVVGNLLNNASKFTPKGGRIRIRVERQGAEATVRVRDSGIGIAADQLPAIFEMFSQVDTSLERSREGLGIGLSLVKTLIEMHGGAVEAQSQGKGRGSEFTVHLPVMEESRVIESNSIAAPTTAATTLLRILVVDDNRDSASSLATLLKRLGHTVALAHDGQEAVEVASTFQPDVVLLDIGLPKLNGYEAAPLIRQKCPYRKLVLVALTGWGQQEDRRRSEEAGFDAHMVKPVDFKKLTELIGGVASPTA